MQSLQDRVAVITGGTSGIGAAIARAFHAEGATVVVADRNRPEVAGAILDLLEGDDARVHYRGLEVTEAEQIGELFVWVEERFGGADILVNSVGYSTHANVVDMTLEEWRQVIDINLTATFLCARAALPAMLSRGRGRIINIASQLGQLGAAEVAHFSASKAGVIGFSKALAREVIREGVNVNVIAPGPVNTPALAREPEEWRRAKMAGLPIGRFGEVEEIAPTAVLLASDAGSFYVGQTLGPNGGDVML